MLKILIWAAAAAAASGQVRLTEEDAVAQAMAARLSLKAASERVLAAEAIRRQAGLWPNPRFTFLAEGVRFWGTPPLNYGQDVDTFANLTQLFQTGGKRSGRVAEAGAAVQQAELKRELEQVQIAARVRQAYWRAAAARKLCDLLVENVSTFGQIVQYHRARVQQGVTAEADLIRVELQGQQFESDLTLAVLEADRARIELLREMGSTSFPEIEFASALEPKPDETTPDLNQALKKRVDVRLARADVAHARAALQLARTGAKPDVDVLFGYERTGGYNTLVAGVEIPIPFVNRNQGEIAAAEHELRASEATLAAQEALVKADVEAAWRYFDLRRRQLLEFFPALCSRAEGSAKIARAAYREGGADLLRLLDSERTRIEAQILYYRALGDYQQSRVLLDYMSEVQK